jgi:hypothetical protein
MQENQKVLGDGLWDEDQDPGVRARTLEEGADRMFEEGTDERFVLEDDKRADWAVEKVLAYEAERDRLIGLAKYKIADLENRIASLGEEYGRKTVYLRRLLLEFFESRPPSKVTTTQRTYALLSGRLVLRKQQPKIMRDDAALLAWAETSAPEFVRTEKHVSWDGLKKKATLEGGEFLLDGEVIPGVKAEERPDVFEIKS